MNYSSRFWLFAPLAIFLGLATWAMGLWWVAASALDKKLTALNGHEAVPGITMSYTTKTISGFPFNIDVVFTGFKIAGAGAHGPFAWTTERFALHRLTYGRTQDIYEAAGQQHLDWTDAKGTGRTLTFMPGALRASAITDGKGLSRFDLDLKAVSGMDAGAPFTAGRLQFHLRRDPRHVGALDLMASADELHEQASQLHTLRAYSTLTQAGALSPLLAGAMSWPDADAAWRKAGGTVEAGEHDTTPAGADGGLLGALQNALY